MGKTIKQSTAKSYNRQTAERVSGKFAGREFYGKYAAPMNHRLRGVLGKLRKTSATQYFIVRVNPDLKITAAEGDLNTKVKFAKALFSEE